MIQLHNRFHIKIKNTKFVNDDGYEFTHTATVTIFDKNENIVFSEDYGHLPTNKIYDLIDTGDLINLNQCYIENFSLTAYRRTRLIHKESTVKLKGFSASNTLFSSKFQIDFSFADFGDYPVTFQKAYFANGLVNFHNAKFGKSDVDFSESVFKHGHVKFDNMRHESGNFLFRSAKFGNGDKIFQDCHFGDGEKSWGGSQFNNGALNFINCKFGSGRTSFRFSTIGEGLVDFHFSTFGNGEHSFETIQWGDGLFNFSKVIFGKCRVNFNRSIFGDGNINFDGMVFEKGKFNIKWVDFGSGNISFEQAEMAEVIVRFDKARFDRGKTARVSFNRSQFKSLSLRSCHLDDYFDLRIAKSDYIDLTNTIVRDIVDLKTYEYQIDLKELKMGYMRLVGQIDIDWHMNGVKNLILNQKSNDYWLIAEQFRVLKENFNKIGRYIDEDKAYVEFKRAEQKAILKENASKQPINALWEYPYYYFKLIIFDKVGLYATDPIRVMVSMLVFYAFFSLAYMGLSYFGYGEIVSAIHGQHEQFSVEGRSFFFSIVTFLTIGYGDFYPMGTAFRILSGIEGFVGLFLMSYFTVAFVRKILR